MALRTRILRGLLLGASVLVWAAGASAADTGAPIVTVNPVTLKDTAQNKDLTLRVTAPLEGKKLPIIIFAHGAQYSKDDYLPLAEFWASQGYVVIQPTHDESLSLGLPRDDPRVKTVWKSRILDLKHVIDALDEIERKAPPIKGRLDHKHIIAAGHSFGGHTASAMVGAQPLDVTSGKHVDLSDPRVSAAILMAPPGYAPNSFLDTDWNTMGKPVLLIAGHNDILKGFNDKWEFHADPYYKGAGGNKCLAVMEGMTHYLGGILGTNRTEELTPSPASYGEIKHMTLAFLNTWAKGTKDWDATRQAFSEKRPDAIAIFECK